MQRAVLAPRCSRARTSRNGARPARRCTRPHARRRCRADGKTQVLRRRRGSFLPPAGSTTSTRCACSSSITTRDWYGPTACSTRKSRQPARLITTQPPPGKANRCARRRSRPTTCPWQLDSQARHARQQPGSAGVAAQRPPDALPAATAAARQAGPRVDGPGMRRRQRKREERASSPSHRLRTRRPRSGACAPAHRLAVRRPPAAAPPDCASAGRRHS